MKKPVLVSFFLGALMVTASIVSVLITPVPSQANQRLKINLETLIPGEFGGWKIDPFTMNHIVNPTIKDQLAKIYSQTLSRAYINSKGERVMLSIAYGESQRTDLHAHRPEICYASSGFDVSNMAKVFIDTTVGRIPVMRLVAKQGTRNEPITYWIRVGETLTRGWIEQKLAAIGYGLTGKLPDGILVRVSTISNDEQDSYRIQQAFLDAMLQAIKSEERFWLIGHVAL